MAKEIKEKSIFEKFSDKEVKNFDTKYFLEDVRELFNKVAPKCLNRFQLFLWKSNLITPPQFFSLFGFIAFSSSLSSHAVLQATYEQYSFSPHKTEEKKARSSSKNFSFTDFRDAISFNRKSLPYALIYLIHEKKNQLAIDAVELMFLPEFKKKESLERFLLVLALGFSKENFRNDGYSDLPNEWLYDLLEINMDREIEIVDKFVADRLDAWA